MRCCEPLAPAEAKSHVPCWWNQLLWVSSAPPLDSLVAWESRNFWELHCQLLALTCPVVDSLSLSQQLSPQFLLVSSLLFFLQSFPRDAQARFRHWLLCVQRHLRQTQPARSSCSLALDLLHWALPLLEPSSVEPTTITSVSESSASSSARL